MSVSITDVVRAASRRLGEEVRPIAPAPWGSKNSTWICSIGHGQGRVVVQAYQDRDAGIRRTRVTEFVGASSAVPVPDLLVSSFSDADIGASWAVWSYIDGQPGYVAAEWNLAHHSWPSMAAQMGRVLGLIRAIDARSPLLEFEIPTQPSEEIFLELDRIRPYVGQSIFASARCLLLETIELVGLQPTVLTHGDYGPQNALFNGSRLVAVIDWEDARLSHPALDISWWNWLLRAHTPEAFNRSWTTFSRVDANRQVVNATSARQRKGLALTRMVETTAHYRDIDQARYEAWAQRVATEVAEKEEVYA